MAIPTNIKTLLSGEVVEWARIEFKKILNALEANGSPKPEFETNDEHSYFISRLFVHEAFLKKNTDDLSTISNSLELNEKNERRLSEVLSEVLKAKDYDKVLPIIQILEKQLYITPREAMDASGKSSATTRRYLNILTATGKVVAEGNTNNIVYRIAE